MTAHEMTMTMVRDVLYNTGITATAGIGTNLFLAKVAMDIVAKKAKPDKDGVRIAALDEMSFREILWTHRPLTDFWRIGGGTAARLEAMQLFTLGDVARASLDPAYEAVSYTHLSEHLNGNAGSGIMGKMCVQNGICDLIAELVGMTGTDGFRRNQPDVFLVHRDSPRSIVVDDLRPGGRSFSFFFGFGFFITFRRAKYAVGSEYPSELR